MQLKVEFIHENNKETFKIHNIHAKRNRFIKYHCCFS